MVAVKYQPVRQLKDRKALIDLGGPLGLVLFKSKINRIAVKVLVYVDSNWSSHFFHRFEIGHGVALDC